MKHLAAETGQPPRLVPLCGADPPEDGLYQLVALHSDCDKCRAAVMVGPVAAWPVTTFPVYKPEPHADASTALARLQKHRDGWK